MGYYSNFIKDNIIIAGAARAGKSTISHMISKRYGYQHIIMDSINAGFNSIFPELGINTHVNMPSFEIFKNISGKIAPFINAMMDDGRYDEFEQGMVLDVYQLLPEDFMKYIDKKSCKIYYFVTADVSIDERVKIMRKYDNEKHYTYGMTDKELYKFCADRIEESKIIKEQCARYNLQCYETSQNRKEIIEQFLQSLAD
ncbi:hypothetical protein FACS189476_10880 [Spirochaetia bacterium]|nr:hypothetical protein FACS189476_10880 [Spirochaetia bacterium]